MMKVSESRVVPRGDEGEGKRGWNGTHRVQGNWERASLRSLELRNRCKRETSRRKKYRMERERRVAVGRMK
jgi:hypothetical protein